MVTFALPSEQDPLVFEKVGPKISVGLVGLIKVHFSSISLHYFWGVGEIKNQGKQNHDDLQALRYLNPSQICSFLFFNELKLTRTPLWLCPTHTQPSMGKAAVVFAAATMQKLTIRL